MSSVRNTVATTIGMVFWAAPVIAVENFSVSSSVVVRAGWVVVRSFTALEVVILAAVACLDAFS